MHHYKIGYKKDPMYVMESAPGPRTTINGRKVDYFCGTSYYGLHGHPELIKAACKASKKYGIGSATSRFGYGDNPVLLEVEQRAAKFFEKALLFSMSLEAPIPVFPKQELSG